MTRQHRNARVTARQDTDPAVRPGTAPAGAGNEAAVAATPVPPLSGGPRSHGSEAAHAFTIADSGGGDLCHDSCWLPILSPPISPRVMAKRFPLNGSRGRPRAGELDTATGWVGARSPADVEPTG